MNTGPIRSHPLRRWYRHDERHASRATIHANDDSAGAAEDDTPESSTTTTPTVPRNIAVLQEVSDLFFDHADNKNTAPYFTWLRVLVRATDVQRSDPAPNNGFG